jgi:hypothetical protein
MNKRRSYRELPDVEVSPEEDAEVWAMIDAAERDIAERRARGELPGPPVREAPAERQVRESPKSRR